MKVISFLLHRNGRKTFAVAGLGLLSGIANAGLIATVNSALHAGSAGHLPRSTLALIFAALMLAKVGGSLASGLLLGRVSQESILNLCMDLCRKVVATPFRALEEIGPARVLTCLTEDISVLSQAIQAIPPLLINLAVMGGCAIYLAWVSWAAGLLLLLLVAAVGFGYKLLVMRAHTDFQRARQGREILSQHFRSLTEGIKELKIHRGRREAFFREDLDATAEYLRRQNTVALNRYALADGWGQAMFCLVLAALLFVLPALNRITPDALTAYVVAALYVMAPVWGIIGAMPGFSRGEASLKRLEELGLALRERTGPEPPAGDSADASLAPSEIHHAPPLVEFRNVGFAYTGKADDDVFTLGPINVALNPGELIFIIGGNGSGKSTLVKLLTGLYEPDTGEIRVGGKKISAADQEDYRQLFSVVYSDFYLFDRLLGTSGSDVEKNARAYLGALDLSHKVRIEGATFSTTALSQGQRRRLALLAAYMEDRSIYVLDEWAADQDPSFREVFYLKILQELKKRGKTVVVITHDDRYFHLGDRVIKLECGKVLETIRPGTSPDARPAMATV